MQAIKLEKNVKLKKPTKAYPMKKIHHKTLRVNKNLPKSTKVAANKQSHVGIKFLVNIGKGESNTSKIWKNKTNF